ncbi:MAG: hypothetical protein HY906_16950 [Deltaproteobacteria bacterium]|nr:hypothetical protein [Deltaproteobacteria bacterium]
MGVEINNSNRSVADRALDAFRDVACQDKQSQLGKLGTPLAGLPPVGPLPIDLVVKARAALCARTRTTASEQAPPRAPTPQLDTVVKQARQAQPAKPPEPFGIDRVERAGHKVEVAHLLAETLESAHAAGIKAPTLSPNASMGLGIGSALALFVKINIEIARANNDGIHNARCAALAQGFARVTAAAVAQGGLSSVQRNAAKWPIPASIPNRNDSDYAKGVRAALETFKGMSRDDLARVRADIVRSTPNVTGSPASEANVASRLSVILGGYAGDTRTRF